MMIIGLIIDIILSLGFTAMAVVYLVNEFELTNIDITGFLKKFKRKAQCKKEDSFLKDYEAFFGKQ